ncbi:hypothetical protein [Desulfotomaculum sp. 1211_IL3151]|uniref:hypothetical protein n=1 Tax=Desulfotomaculum sp. 1211_IL3151 TaxID=3084055 RepID=UPI002FDA230B
MNNKSNQIIAITMLSVLLFALPFFEEIHYTVLYYVVIILFIPIAIYRIILAEKFEARFYKRWQKAKEQGFWVNVVREGTRSLVSMIVLISTSQLFGNGRTPLEIVSKLPGSTLVWISLFLLAFNLVVGIVAWHENNKKYNRIHGALQNNNK